MIPQRQWRRSRGGVLVPSYTYAIWNNADRISSSIVASAGGLQVDEAVSTFQAIRGDLYNSTGVHYFESTLSLSAGASFNCFMGMMKSTEAISTGINVGDSMVVRSAGTLFAGTTGATVGTASSFVNGDVLQMLVDFDNEKAWFGVNGTWMNGADPDAGTNPQFSAWSGGSWAPYFAVDNNSSNHRCISVFGPTFTYTPPLSSPGWVN